ncbi:MAG: peptidylprolyl isomerase [Chloroflexota bacterium]
MRFRSITLLICLTLATACSGALAEPPAPDAPAQQPTTAAPQTATLPPVVATVNGAEIGAEAYERALRRRQREVAVVADPAALANTVLTELINQQLVRQAAVTMGIEVTEADVDTEIADLKALIDNDAAAWATWLEANNYTEDQLRVELEIQLITAQVRDNVIADVNTSDAAQVQARHILVPTREEAITIRARLASGEDFVDLAAQYSRDVTTRDQGGDLGWFTREGLLEPVVAEVAFGQQPGEISAPTATRLGWHIIETLNFDTLPLPPEKQAEVAQAVFEEWLLTQTDSAIIEINLNNQ